MQMKDEQFVFLQDAREKKNIARSSRNRRTHNGRRGAVKFPSDYLTKKEWNAMNGEVKSYRINEPMTWHEFKALPDEIKITYIKAIRERFNPPDAQIARMLGGPQATFSKYVKDLGLMRGQGKTTGYNKRAFWDWVEISRAKTNAALEEIPVCPASEPLEDESKKALVKLKEAFKPFEHAVPCSGELAFNGNAEEALKTVTRMLGSASVKITIKWEALEEGAADIGRH
jgi:hypothetical protein